MTDLWPAFALNESQPTDAPARACDSQRFRDINLRQYPARFLLDFDCGASFRELLLDVLGFFLVDAFFDRFGSAINQVLRLF